MRDKNRFSIFCFSFKEDKISRFLSLGLLSPHLYTKSYGRSSVEAPKMALDSNKGKKREKFVLNV